MYFKIALISNTRIKLKSAMQLKYMFFFSIGAVEVHVSRFYNDLALLVMFNL